VLSSPERAIPSARRALDEIVLEGRSMATRLSIRLLVPQTASAARQAAIELAGKDALGIFAKVEANCTRFDLSSPLMRANRHPRRPHRVPPVLLAAIAEAKRAYDTTGGRFDPRILRNLVGLGYGRTLPFGGSKELDLGPAITYKVPSGPFRPRLRWAASEVVIGTDPIDLGGIGKGLALRWATEALLGTTHDFLVDAGGDCACWGSAPDGGPWLVGVEDPLGGSSPIAVLALSREAVATSSTRLRRWRAGGREVHHLIDPATGRPGGKGLRAVSVVGPDPAMAEVWAKALLLAGASRIGPLARRRGLKALWVEEGGSYAYTSAMEPHLRWCRA
jgi:thiamine biosynthesis lipoprotein